MKQNLKQALKRVPGVPKAVAQLRHGRRQLQMSTWRRPSVVKRKIAAYLKVHAVGKLQIGSGPHLLAGWLNTDFEPVSDASVFMDATRPFPLPDAIFSHVFSEHMIEHINYEQGLFMLRECARVMQPGGRIRIATPNLRNIACLLNEPHSDLQRRYLEFAVGAHWPEPKVSNACYLLNQFMHSWGHQFVYDPATLRHSFERCGFTSVTECAVGESTDSVLGGLECHGKQIGEEWNRFETMVLEARRT